MDRVHQSGAAVAAPATPGSFSTGYPTAGNPSGGVPATKPGPWWYHMVTEELRGVVTTAGLTPDGTDLTQLAAAIQAMIASAAAAQHGQCHLDLSGGNLVLLPKNGNKLVINGTPRAVPAAGVSLAASGLSVGTTYMIYAYWTGSAMALEASTTGYATDSTTGVEIKSGDATRTLVGMARPVTGPAWVNSRAQRLVRSYFNGGFEGGNAFAANRSTSSTSYAELSSGERVEFLAWASEILMFSVAGSAYNNYGGLAYNWTAIFVDGTQLDAYTQAGTTTGGSERLNCSLSVKTGALAEGYHYASIHGKVDFATGTWLGSGSTGARVVLNVSAP